MLQCTTLRGKESIRRLFRLREYSMLYTTENKKIQVQENSLGIEK